MPATYKTLCTIKAVSDTETSMYKTGEINAMFHKEALKEHIRNYGSADLIESIAHLQYQIVAAINEIIKETPEHVPKLEITDTLIAALNKPPLRGK